MQPAGYLAPRAASPSFREHAGDLREGRREAQRHTCSHGNTHARGFALPDRRVGVHRSHTLIVHPVFIVPKLPLVHQWWYTNSKAGIGRRGGERAVICIRNHGPSTRGGKLR
jgi:hypothetical protein